MLIAAIEPLPDAALHLPFAAAASPAQRQALPRCRRIVARPAASFSSMPQQRRSPSGKLFRTGCRFAPSLRNAPASCFRRLPVPAAPLRRPGQLLSPAARTSSFATAPRPAASAGCPYQQLHHVTPASNKPHPAEKSTPVWLAIWRTWAGFANSQLRRAAFRSTY